MRYTKVVDMLQVPQDIQLRCSDMHSIDGGRTLLPIMNLETVGQRPRDFSPDRSFWRIVEISEN